MIWVGDFFRKYPECRPSRSDDSGSNVVALRKTSESGTNPMWMLGGGQAQVEEKC